MECGNVSCGGGDGRKKVILMSLFDDCGLVGGACSGTYVLVTFFLSVSVCLKPDTPSYAYSLSVSVCLNPDTPSYAYSLSVSVCLKPDTPSYAYSLSEDQTSYATDFMVLSLSLSDPFVCLSL